VRKRGGEEWAVLDTDFPLYPGWQALEQYAGIPAFVALSHADAWGWLERFPGHDVLNIDSHHDLASFSGDAARVRPGNWAGLGLRAGLIRRYTCLYPPWHAALPVAEGYDLNRTRAELEPLLPELLGRVTLTRPLPLPPPAEVEALLLVQSPAWTNPAHDAEFLDLAQLLKCETLTQPMHRSRFDDHTDSD
ncbi:arginase, partial [Deinococcus saxicola]